MTNFAQESSYDYSANVREDGFHGIQDSIEDWAIASDEAGEPIYCERGIAEFLGQDIH